jgi:hypothetical protein
MGHLHLTGNYSFKQLGRAFGLSDKTVKHHIAPMEEAVHSIMNGVPIPAQGSGVNPTSSAIQNSRWLERHFIIMEVLKNPNISDREISRAMQRIDRSWPECGWACSASTVCRHIRDMHINCTESTKRPLMKEQHQIARLEFAHLANENDPRFQLPWYFSDESSIDLNPYRQHAYRVPGITTTQGVYQNSAKHPPPPAQDYGLGVHRDRL